MTTEQDREELFRLWELHGTSYESDSYEGWALVDAILAAGFVRGEVEWGYMLGHLHGRPIRAGSREYAEQIAREFPDLDPKVYRRHVTDWSEA